MIKCARCGETRLTYLLWCGFVTTSNADVVCCLVDTDRLVGSLTSSLARRPI